MRGNHGRTIVVTFLMSAALSLGPFARTGEGASATGLAHFTFDDGTLRTVSFNATSQRNNIAVGQIDIRDGTPIANQDVDGTGDPDLAGSPNGVNLNAQVNCLVVDDSTAIVGGEIAHANVARYVGKYVLLFVEDRGQRSQPRLSWGFYDPDQGISCDSFPSGAYAPVEVTSGSVKVRP